ncbi:MAG: efflux RND transporter periplasmic adaptor subunit [Lentisphaeria bacterium]|nr:efflux RND transporter periplasmic adaptor subunit [Lentisphaeria bacterium]
MNKIKSLSKSIGLVLLGFILGFIILKQIPTTNDKHHIHETTADVQEDVNPTTWTCSMHPQIKLPKLGKCPICFMDLIPLESGGNLQENQVSINAKVAEYVNIETVPILRGYPTMTIDLVGNVEIDETKIAIISSWISGRLDNLYVDYTGIPIKEGEHLVKIYSPELFTAQQEYIQAIKAKDQAIKGNSDLMQKISLRTYEASRRKLELLGLQKKQIADLDASLKASPYINVYSPASGIVTKKIAKEGMYVKKGEPLYQIASFKNVWIEFDAYEGDVKWIHYGMKIGFQSRAIPGKKFTGQVSFIDPLFNEKTRTVRVRINVDNQENLLKPGMYVRGHAQFQVGSDKALPENLKGKWISPMHPEILKDQKGHCDVCGMDLIPIEEYLNIKDEEKSEAPLLIPASAPLITGNRAVVYRLVKTGEQNIYEGIEVDLGSKVGNQYIVLSGLSEGDQVVSNGAFKLDAELQIQAKPSMMSMGPEEVKVSELNYQLSGQNQDALKQLLEHYAIAQENFATDDFEAGKTAIQQLSKSLENIDMKSMDNDSLMYWMKEIEKLQSPLKEVVESNNFEEARKTFSIISSILIRLIENYQVNLSGYTQVHCSMALNNKGANWLQKSGNIQNPYYGSQMLACGNVVKEYKLEEAAIKVPTSLIDQYFKLWKSLSEDKEHKSVEQATEILIKLKENEVLQQAILKNAKEILAYDFSKTHKIANVREFFRDLSNWLIPLVKQNPQENVFLGNCSMAFDNKGASWLQNSQDLTNPYWGSAMLRCGTIEPIGVSNE